MAEAITRVTLFVPGAPASAKRALGREVAVEWVENDGHFGKAFFMGTLTPHVIDALEATPGALVLQWPVDLREGRKKIVAAVKKLRDAGALAVRIEESKLGWGISRWIDLFSSEVASSWHRGAVAFLHGEDVIQSCGMHAFSLPDVQIGADGDAAALQELATTFNVYQLAEDPELWSGHTFRPDEDTPRRRVERWPDTQYPPDHACHNPYGVWRLGPPGSTARPDVGLVFNFTPALRVILLALETKKGKPLTKKEVEAARDKSACIAMKPHDAQAVERARGYADINPELAWEQWKLVRPLANR